MRRFRIFILGAGFSRPAGLPLSTELWGEIRHRVSLLHGRARRFDGDLEEFLRYKEECFGLKMTADEVDFEDFMRFLDIEHFLGMRGSDTWSRSGNEATIVVKTLIGQILTERTPPPDRIPELYLKFASGLQPDDYILTFNYDVLLERALDAVGKPYRLFPTRYKSILNTSAIADKSKDEIILLKLHGSLDWFDRTDYRWLEDQRRQAGLGGPPPDPVFAHENELGVAKLLDGPRFPADPLDQMYRVRHVDALYSRPILFSATPWLLAPSPVKLLYADTLREFWHGIGNAGILNFGLAIIGYSLPPQDEYARQVLHAIVTNYQRAHWDDEIGGLRKRPLVIVDRCDDAHATADLKLRYRFVNWDRALLCPGGLDHGTVEQLFAEAG